MMKRDLTSRTDVHTTFDHMKWLKERSERYKVDGSADINQPAISEFRAKSYNLQKMTTANLMGTERIL